MKRYTLFDAVKTAEDAGLDAMITYEDTDSVIIVAVAPGPRRDARDYIIRASVSVTADGGIGGYPQFAEACLEYIANRVPKQSDLWFQFTGGRKLMEWGYGTAEQASNYAAERGQEYVHVAGEPDDEGATITNLRLGV